MTVTKKILAYTRQSQGRSGETEESSLSLNAQLDRIRSHCAREGWEIVGTIQDHDLSGEKWDRPGIQQLMDRVRAGGVDLVVVFSISRIARKVLHQEMVMDVLTEHGVELVSVSEAGLDNILVRVVHAGMAEQHNVNHRKILKATLEARAKRGLHHGPAPFGYQVRTTTGAKGLDILPDQAEIVRELYRRRADGESLGVLAVWLQDQGIQGQRGALVWHLTSVQNVLTNPLYAGYATHKREITGDIAEGHAEPIVDRAQWHQVQRTFGNQVRYRGSRERRQSWLEGFVRHSCGSAMGINVYGHGTVMFRCNRAAHNRGVHCTELPLSLHMDAMELAVRRCLDVDLQAVPVSAEAIVQHRANELGQPSAVKRREKLERQRTGLLEQIIRAEQMVTTGRRDFVWFDAFDKDAQERIAALDAELATLSAIPTVQDIAGRIDAVLRLRRDMDAAIMRPDLVRNVLAVLGVVVFDQGIVRIDYAPEYRDLFPRPHRVKPRYCYRPRSWIMDDCR